MFTAWSQSQPPNQNKKKRDLRQKLCTLLQNVILPFKGDCSSKVTVGELTRKREAKQLIRVMCTWQAWKHPKQFPRPKQLAWQYSQCLQPALSLSMSTCVGRADRPSEGETDTFAAAGIQQPSGRAEWNRRQYCLLNVSRFELPRFSTLPTSFDRYASSLLLSTICEWRLAVCLLYLFARHNWQLHFNPSWPGSFIAKQFDNGWNI